MKFNLWIILSGILAVVILFFARDHAPEEDGDLERQVSSSRKTEPHKNLKERITTSRIFPDMQVSRDDLSGIKITTDLDVKEEYRKTLHEEAYLKMREARPHAPNTWVGMVGSAWKGENGYLPEMELFKLREIIDEGMGEIPEGEESLIVEGDGAITSVRRYLAFDQIMDMDILKCAQEEVRWIEEKNYYILYRENDNQEKIGGGVAIRKTDGSVMEWNVDR